MSKYSTINDIFNLSVARTNAIQLAYSAWGMRLFRTMPWSPILTDPESVVFTRYWTSFYSSNRFLEKCCSENSYSLKKRLIKKYYPRYLKKMPQPRIGLKILPTKLFWSKAANKIKKVRPRSYSRAYSRVQTSQVASKTYVGRKLKKNSNLQNLTRYFAVGLTGVIFKSPITIKKSRQNAIIRRNPQYTRRYRLRRQKVAVSPAVLPPGRADLLDTWTENLALFKQQEALADQRVLYPSRFLGQDLIMYRRLPVKSSLRLALVSDHWSRSRLGYFYRAKQLDRSWVDRSLRVLTFQQEMFRLYGSPSLKRKLYSKKKKATIAFYRRLTPRCLRSRRRRRLSSLVPRVRSSRGCKVPLVRGYVVLKKKQDLLDVVPATKVSSVAKRVRPSRSNKKNQKDALPLYYTQKQRYLGKARNLIGKKQLWTPPGAIDIERDVIVFNRFCWISSFQVPWRWRMLLGIINKLNSSRKLFSRNRPFRLGKINSKGKLRRVSRPKNKLRRKRSRRWWPKPFYMAIGRFRTWWTMYKRPRRIKGWLNYPDNNTEHSEAQDSYALHDIRASRNRLLWDKRGSLYQNSRFSFKVMRRYNFRKLSSVALVLKKWKQEPYSEKKKSKDKENVNRKYIEFDELRSRIFPVIDRKIKKKAFDKLSAINKAKRLPTLKNLLVQKNYFLSTRKVKGFTIHCGGRVKRRRRHSKRYVMGEENSQTVRKVSSKKKKRFSRRPRRYKRINKKIDPEATRFGGDNKPYLLSRASLESWPEKLEQAKEKKNKVYPTKRTKEKEYNLWLQRLRRLSELKKAGSKVLLQQMKSKLFGVFLRRGRKHDIEKKMRLFKVRNPRWDLLNLYKSLYCPVTMVHTRRTIIKLGTLKKVNGLLARLDRPAKAFVRSRHWLAAAAQNRKQRHWWTRTVAELLNPRGAIRSSRRYAKEVSRVAASN